MTIASVPPASSGYRRFVVARTASVAGDWATRTALPAHLMATSGPRVAGAAIVLITAPRLLSPLAGVVADRIATRRILVATELVALLAAVAMLRTLGEPMALLGLIAVSSVASAFFAPAGRGAVADLVEERELERANATLTMWVTAASVIGPLLAAAILAVGDIAAVVAVDVATFAISAALLASLRQLDDRTRPSPTLFVDVRAVVSLMRVGTDFRLLLAVVLLMSIAVGISRPALLGAAAGLGSVRAGMSSYPVIVTLGGLGVIVGALTMARSALRASLALRSSAWLQVLGHALLALAPNATVVGLAAAVAGAAAGLQQPAVDSTLHRTMPVGVLGRAFGALLGVAYVGETLGAVAGALLVSTAGSRVAAGAAAAGAAAAFGAQLSALRRRG